MEEGKKKHLLRYIIIAVNVCLIIGVGTWLWSVNSDPNHLSKKEKKNLLAEYQQEVLDLEVPSKVYQDLKALINKVDESERSDMVDGFVYTMYQYANRATTLLEANYLEEATRLSDEGYTFKTLEEVKEVASEPFLTFLNKLNSEHAYLSKVNNELRVQPNLAPVLNEFYDYMDPALQGLLEFNDKETYLSFQDEDGNIELDETALRVVELEALLLSTNESYYYDKFKELYDFYLEVYLGTFHRYHYIEGTETYRPEIIEHFEKMQVSFPESDLVKVFLAIMVPDLKEHGGILTDNARGEIAEKLGQTSYIDLDDKDHEVTTEELEEIIEEQLGESK